MAKAKESFLQEDDTDITPAQLMGRITGGNSITGGQSTPPPHSPEQSVHNITGVQESTQVHNNTAQIVDNKEDITESPQAYKSTNNAEDNERSKRIRRAEAMISEAEESGEAPVLITMRVPAKLHDYLERYVRRINDNSPNKRKRYLKQDAVAAAFVAFYADHPMPAKLMDNDDDL